MSGSQECTEKVEGARVPRNARSCMIGSKQYCVADAVPFSSALVGLSTATNDVTVMDGDSSLNAMDGGEFSLSYF